MSNYRVMDLTRHLLTLLLADRPVKPRLEPESAAATATRVGVGPKPFVLLAKYDRATGLFSKIQEGLPLFATVMEPEPLEEYSEPYPRWGIASRGELGELVTWELPTSANVSSSWGDVWPTSMQTDEERLPIGPQTWPSMWPTPRAGESSDRTSSPGNRFSLSAAMKQMWPTPTSSMVNADRGGMEYAQRCVDKGVLINLAHQVKADPQNWPTPSASNGEGSRTVPEGTTSTGMTPDGKKRMVGLNNAAQLWPTPQAHDAAPGDPSRVGRFGTEHGGRNLNDEAALEEQHRWPTPRASDGDKGGPNQAGSKGDLMLPSAAVQWSTPNARDYKGVDNTRKERGAHGGDSLPTQVDHASTSMSAEKVGASAPVGSLNPAWVSILVGLPPTYLDLTDSLENVTAWVRNPRWPARPGETQHAFEPPRLGKAIPQRIKKLSALGNIVVAPQAVPIFAALMQQGEW